MRSDRNPSMEYDALIALRRTHPTWRLLAAEHAPLIAAFLHRTFITSNVRTISRTDLVAKLEDYLHDLRSRAGEEAFPKPAAEYLDDWASDRSGWLRKYYPPNDDDPRFDLTAATEKAIEWLAGLQRRQFIGTESRLKTVFELLRQMTAGTETDVEVRLFALEKRRAELDAEIQDVRAGRFTMMEPAQIKDRFVQMEGTARALLSDFREVEQNFRVLDRATRERIATWDGGKGALLAQIFGERDAINDSDQGRSFHAFWDFLMSPATQEELTAMLLAVVALPAIKELHPDSRLLRIHYDWLEAGEVTQATVRKLSSELRRYLDDEARREDRRILGILHAVEQRALSVRSAAPPDPFMEIDETSPDVSLPMERPLFSVPFKPNIAAQALVAGEPDLSADSLFRQVFVDRARLMSNIRHALQELPQVSLGELVKAHPLQQGLAEVVTYLTLAAEDRNAVIDDRTSEIVLWNDARKELREARLPLVIFCRSLKGVRSAQQVGDTR